MKILLVDDEKESRACVADFLRDLGHEVVECADGYEALTHYHAQEFHLVLSDVRMPKMNGVTLVQNIREFEDGRNVYIVLFSGNVELETAAEAMRIGANEYLFKPIGIEDLINITDRAVEYQVCR